MAQKKTVAQPTTTELNEESVLAWLQENPAFLLRHGEKFQPEGDNVTPMHAVRAARAEKSHDTLQKRQQRLLRTVQANSATAENVFMAIPPLVQCRTLAQLRKYLQTDLKKLLELDAVRLLLAGDEATATSLPVADIQAFFDEDDATLRTLYEAADRTLYGPTGKMFKSDCLLKLAAEDGTTIGLLAMASKDETRFHPGQGAELATFLGRVIAAVLEGVLE